MFSSDWHKQFNASFTRVNGQTLVLDYGSPLKEYDLLRQSAGIIDLTSRSRLVLLGADRQRFLHGQVTNEVQKLKPGEGCYAALTNAKAKMVSDLNIYIMAEEILLDFEPGYAQGVAERLQKYIVADDVQIEDVSPHYALLSVQGPSAPQIIEALQLKIPLPQQPMRHAASAHPQFGEVYLMNQPRLGTIGFDLYIPHSAYLRAADALVSIASHLGGGLAGWTAFETARIEAGIPRYGVDMDETNLAPETGIAAAIRYDKGCYIGQEIIARIRTYGQVTKSLRGLRLSQGMKRSPAQGAKLFRDGKEAGYITSATFSPALQAHIALGYVRREANQPGIELTLETPDEAATATVFELPFSPGYFENFSKSA